MPLAPTIANHLLLFEVMDKEPPLWQTAILYIVPGLLGAGLSRKKWWLGILVLPLVFTFAWIDYGELHDPFVGPAIVHEAGVGYVLAWHSLIVLGIVLPIGSAMMFSRSKRTAPSSSK